MHGDAHLNNVLLRRDRPELAAFIDWEMCTVGDPLLDLGWMLVCWPDDPNTIDAGCRARRARGSGESARAARRLPGGGRPEDVAARLVLALACFKLGIVIEGTWSRYLAGQASWEAGQRLHASRGI